MRTLLPVIAIVACACGSKSKQKRAGDAAPVEVIQQPVLGDAGAGSGASGDEVEPNDGEDVATPLPVGSTLRGRIDPETDADYFKVEVKDPGVLGIELTAVDGVDLTLELLDASGTSLARSDRGGVRVREGLPNLGVTPGRYTAVVRARKPPPAKQPPVKKGKKPAAVTADAGVGPSTAPVYEITATIGAPAANAEREPDDDRGTANDLIVGDTATGFVGWTADADVWKLSIEALSAKNALDIEVSAVEGVSLSLEVADAIGHVLLTRKAPKGAPLAVRGFVPVVPAGASPFEYLTVRGDRSNPETPYQLRVVEKPPVADAEVEPDDAPDHPMVLPVERTILHGTWTPGDVDYYAMPVAQGARNIEITLDPPADADLSAELLVDGKPVGKGDRPGKGAQEKFLGMVPAGVTAILKIHGSDSSAEGTYELSYMDGPGAP